MYKQAYEYGMNLAAREAGFTSWNGFVKAADAAQVLSGGMIGAGLGALGGAGLGALAAPEGKRLRGAGLGLLAGGAAGSLAGTLGTAAFTRDPSLGRALVGAGVGAPVGGLMGGIEYEMQPEFIQKDPNTLSLRDHIALNALSGAALGGMMGVG